MKHALVLILVAVMALPAQARTRLQDDKTIEDGLRLVAIGKLLYRNCDAISPRRIKAFAFARSLQLRARGLGYSDAEIDAYLDSDPDKDRIKGQARSYLEARGVNFDDTATFCTVGRSEISKQTAIGKFLRAR